MEERAPIGGKIVRINAEKGYVVVTPDNRNREFFVDLLQLDDVARGRAKPGAKIMLRREVIFSEKSAISRAHIRGFGDDGSAELALPGETESVYVDRETIRRSGMDDLKRDDNVVVKYKNIQDALIAIDVSRPQVSRSRASNVAAAPLMLGTSTVFDRCVQSKDDSADKAASELAMRLLGKIEDALDDVSRSVNACVSKETYESRDSDGV